MLGEHGVSRSLVDGADVHRDQLGRTSCLNVEDEAAARTILTLPAVEDAADTIDGNIRCPLRSEQADQLVYGPDFLLARGDFQAIAVRQADFVGVVGTGVDDQLRITHNCDSSIKKVKQAHPTNTTKVNRAIPATAKYGCPMLVVSRSFYKTLIPQVEQHRTCLIRIHVVIEQHSFVSRRVTRIERLHLFIVHLRNPLCLVHLSTYSIGERVQEGKGRKGFSWKNMSPAPASRLYCRGRAGSPAVNHVLLAPELEVTNLVGLV
jgi:hypothetical protein